MLNFIKQRLSLRTGVVSSVALVGVMALALFIIPQTSNFNLFADSNDFSTCPNPPATATFNHWPVTYDDDNTPLCHDFPAIDGAKFVSGQTSVFSQSAADWQDGLTLESNEQGVILMYLHNGAANNLDPADTTARNVQVITETDTSVGSQHTVKVTYTADNASTFTKSYTVHTPSNARLEVISNSGQMYDYQGSPIGGGNLNLGNSTYSVGDLNACFEYSLFFSFKFKVVTETTNEDTTLSIDKSVRNLTDGNSYSSSTNADRNDRVEYRVIVRNTGDSVAKDVIMSDAGTSGVDIDRGSVTVGIADDALLTDDLWSGTIPGTLNLGDLDPGESRYITYRGTVTASSGTHTNTAYADASNTSRVSDTARVIVTYVVDEDREIDIDKLVDSYDDSEGYSNRVEVRTGEDVKFKITVKNTGDHTVNNVEMWDNFPSGIDFRSIIRTSNVENYSTTGDNIRVDVGTLTPGESAYIEVRAEVVSTSTRDICNTAHADGDDVDEVSDDACVRIIRTDKPGTPNIVISKKAYNDTKNVDATTTSAARGDYITFTLTTTNTGTETARNYIIRDDLSGVLPLADFISAPNAKLNGNILTYDEIDIRPGQTITKTIKVRVKESLSHTISYQIVNTYGNTVTINIPGKTVYEAPKTGAAGTSAAAFAGLLTSGFFVFRNRESILKFILN